MELDVATWESRFDCKKNAGWLTVRSRDERIRPHFRTSRLAKLLPDGELHFTIGATDHGKGLGLNPRIKEMIAVAGFRSFDRRSTAGGRNEVYPALNVTGASAATLLGLLSDVECEALRIANGFERKSSPCDPKRSLELQDKLAQAACLDLPTKAIRSSER